MAFKWLIDTAEKGKSRSFKLFTFFVSHEVLYFDSSFVFQKGWGWKI